MPTRYSGRVLLSLFVAYVALCCIYPRAPFSLFLPLMGGPASLEHNLRPGIDMVGGTSLIYQIEPPEGSPTAGLSEQVATALKRRVDPNGVRNLVWRPQGDTRLEIQMPLAGDSRQAEEIRRQYLAAQEALAKFNVTAPQVTRAVENGGDNRRQQLEALAMGDPARQAFFNDLAAAYDALQQARQGGSIPAIAAAEARYNELKNGITSLNITVEQVLAALEAREEIRKERIDAFLARDANFPARREAIESLVAVYDDYLEIRNQIADTASLKRLLQGSGVLQFHILAGNDVPNDVLGQMVERLDTVGPRPRAGDTVRWFRVDRPDAVGGGVVRVAPDGNTYALAWVTDEKSLDDRDGDWGLESARAQPDERGFRAVGFRFDALGGRLFGDLSGNHVGQPLAIVLDNAIISAPNLNSRITRDGIITGGRSGFSESESSYLVNTLNAGALPAKLSEQPISERTVGPQLGEDNLRAGLAAMVAGVLIVGVFLIGYYYLSGVVAFIAVLLNLLIILGAMAAMNATFTLPAIAGVILSVGMAVDANVLIFERLREEQARGLSIRMALRNAYHQAFSAIIDSNVTTGVTAVVLYYFGSEEVAGFGLTLLIGIVASLFTALFVTRTIFGLLIDKAGLDDLGSLPRTFPNWDRMLTPNVDWMRLAPVASIGLAAFIVVGLGLFGWAWQRGNVLDIEFAGGTTAQFALKEPTPIAQVRSLVNTESGPLDDAQIVSIEPAGGQRDNTTYEIVVPNADSEAVRSAIVEQIGERLDIQQASLFAGVGAPVGEAFERTVFPVEAEATEVDGLPVDPDIIARNVGGAAVVLRDLRPMLPATEIVSRFNQQRSKGIYDEEGLRGGVGVEAVDFPGDNTAILFVSNERYQFDPSDPEVAAQWQADFAAPVWTVVQDAVARPDELQKVTNIGAQVAGEFRTDATVALVLSILGIMAYVWLRFGDLKFGGATVVALLHDTLFTVAALGFAHLLADTFIGTALLLDPFRLNLTMVAAILTVVGFSVNDTVVIFDRIRENRGKYGLLTAGVINKSINQTLSRTILTGTTSMVTILVMYIFGGPAIHGFTFALIVGLFIGTFSSIVIASPLLLLGRQEETVPNAQPAGV